MDRTVLFLTNCFANYFVNYFCSLFETWTCFFHPSISKCLTFEKNCYLHGNDMPEFFLCLVQILNQSCALMRSQVQRGQILNEVSFSFCTAKYNSTISFLQLHNNTKTPKNYFLLSKLEIISWPHCADELYYNYIVK